MLRHFVCILTMTTLSSHTAVGKATKSTTSGWLQWKNVQSTLSLASDKFITATESMEDFLFGDACPFVHNPAQAVRKHLELNLKAQPIAIKSVVDHITGWYSTDKPLVLSFTGPTGVGKTETATLVAEAILKKKVRMKGGKRLQPKGKLVFNGADFADSSLIQQYHEIITSQFVDVLKICGNQAVVIFDEVQKIAPKTLDVLLSAMSEHPSFTHYDFVTHKARVFDTSKVIFILISDVGADRMFELIQENNGRQHVTKNLVQKEIRQILRKQWKRLDFTSKIDGSVPFLPLEPEHIRQVLDFKLKDLKRSGAKKKLWKSIEWTNDFLIHMTTSKKNQYGIIYKRFQSEASAVAKSAPPRVFAKFGARNVMNDGPLDQIRTKLMNSRNNKNTILQLDVIQNDEGRTIVRLDACQGTRTKGSKGETEEECEDESGSGGGGGGGGGGEKTCSSKSKCKVWITKFEGDLNA